MMTKLDNLVEQQTIPLNLPSAPYTHPGHKPLADYPILRAVLWFGGGVAGFFGLGIVLCLLLGRVVPAAEIAFDSDRGGSSAIYVMDIQRGITLPLIREHDLALVDPVWSPGGQKLAYVAVQKIGQNVVGSSVYIADSDGEKAGLLTDIFAVGNRTLAWSPDGTQVAVAGLSEDLEQVIFVVNADGTGKRQIHLQFPGHAFAPTWSPDGQQIAFSWSPTANAEIWVIPTSEASSGVVNAQRITRDPMLDTLPAWSPDGAWIAFESGRSGNSEIYLMRPDGSDLQAVTNHPAIDTLPAWSPDGKQIVFVSSRDGSSEIYVMDADGSNLRRLTYHDAIDSRPSWRP